MLIVRVTFFLTTTFVALDRVLSLFSLWAVYLVAVCFTLVIAAELIVTLIEHSCVQTLTSNQRKTIGKFWFVECILLRSVKN